MFCRWCGTALPDGAQVCPSCGKADSPTARTSSDFHDEVDQAVKDAARAAHNLAESAARFSDRLAAKMKGAAEDPKGTARRSAHRIAQELDAAREDIEKAIRDL